MDPRIRFKELLERRSVTSYTLLEPLQAEFEEALAQAFRAKFPRKRLPTRNLASHLGDEYDPIRAEFERRADDVYNTWKAEQEAIDLELDSLAAELTPESGASWHLYRKVNSTAYNTQGFGAHSYARASAESLVPQFAVNGLQAEVRVVRWRDGGDPRFSKSDIADYEVWIKAEPLEIEIAARRPGMSLKDWLQWSWDRAINPRVLNPYLPWGLEAKLGVRIGGRVGL